MFAEALAAARVEETHDRTATTPSNQQILAAAQQAYGTYQAQVDALSTACAAYTAAAGNQAALTALASYAWADGAPDAHVVAPIVEDPGIAQALAAFRSPMPSCLVGVTTKDTRDVGITTTGMWAATATPGAPEAVVSAAQAMVTTITVGPGTALAVGVWVDGHPPTTNETGYAIVLSVPAGYALAIAVTSGLAPWGFVDLSAVAVGSAAVASVSLSSVPSTSKVGS